jgi:hypothetical protein
MAALTPAGNPYVESSDLVANYPATSLALANRLDKYAVNPFADAAARDAAIPTPVQGQLAQTLDDNKVWRYDGTAWSPFSGAPGGASFTNTPTGIYTDAGIDYKYITFTGTGNFEIDVAGFADVLVVGGAGGAGRGDVTYHGAGGGAGGFLAITSAYFLQQTYTVIIGAGGPGATANGGTGQNGTSSQVGNYFAVGGGGGGSMGAGATAYGYGFIGGSGGGGARSVVGGAGTTNQGKAGGDAYTGGPPYWAAGGGGAGGVGANATAAGAAGGVGLSSSITNVSTTFSAGGAGSSTVTGLHGLANTGNAGDGGTTSGGGGGSGIVTIRVVV